MKPKRNLFGRLLSVHRKVTRSGRGAFALAKRARDAVPKENWKNLFTTPEGFKLDLDLNIYPDFAIAFGAYELETIRMMYKLLRKGGWFVDGGANIGYLSLIAEQIVGVDGRVDAFEPDPFNRARLEKNLAANGSRAVRVYEFALAAANTHLKLFRATGNTDNHGMSSLYSRYAESTMQFEVDTIRLDRILKGSPDLIKLDIEGAELAAIEGARDILASDKPPAIIVEHNRTSAVAAQFAPGEIYDLLQSIQPRYKIYWIGSRLKEIKSGDELNDIARQGNLLATVD